MASCSLFKYSSLKAFLGYRLEFRVIWEIEMEAASPEEAAQQARAVQLRRDLSATVFGVWEYAGQRMHRIDVERHADRLDRAELTAIRARLRLLQCSPCLHRKLRELVSVMLVFLDREDTMSKSVGRAPTR